MTVRVLGPVELTVGGTPFAAGGVKARSILTVLALNRDRAVGRPELVTAVWGEDSPTGADHSLQQHVSSLRKALEPQRPAAAPSSILLTQSPGYLLRVDELDADDFEMCASRGLTELAAGRADAALDALVEALRLWRGPALADLRDGEWFAAVATRLEDRRLTVVEARAEALIDLGRATEAVTALDGHVADNPFRERALALQMLALYRSGRQADALAAFQSGRRLLGEELGIEPSKALRHLESAILAHDPALSKGQLDGVVELRETYRPDGLHRGGLLQLPDGQLVALSEGTTLIGRVPEARVRLADSRVSRRHAQIDSTSGRHLIHDLGSTNGTSVNGVRADGQPLTDGDVVSVGGLELLFTDRA